MAEVRRSEYVFPGTKEGRPPARGTPERIFRQLNIKATSHGFRSSFRDWAAEMTSFPREAAELALAHAVGDAVEDVGR